MPVVARKPPSRSGKRIEQARLVTSPSRIPCAVADSIISALFGGEQPSESLGLVKQKRARVDEAGSSQIELQESSVVGRLITTELEGALSGSLLDREWRC